VLEPLYWGISWILLQWHALWNFAFQGGQFLVTNWDWVLAIVFLVLTIRTALFPVFVKQIKSQRAMQALAPQIKSLQEKHKGDRETLQKEMMELYRREKANPLMGCLPVHGARRRPAGWPCGPAGHRPPCGPAAATRRRPCNRASRFPRAAPRSSSRFPQGASGGP